MVYLACIWGVYCGRVGPRGGLHGNANGRKKLQNLQPPSCIQAFMHIAAPGPAACSSLFCTITTQRLAFPSHAPSRTASCSSHLSEKIANQPRQIQMIAPSESHSPFTPPRTRHERVHFPPTACCFKQMLTCGVLPPVGVSSTVHS